MPFDPQLQEGILDEELTEDRSAKIKVYAEEAFNAIVEPARQSLDTRTTPGRAKDINEVMSLIEEAIRDYEKREHATEDKKVKFTYEYPDNEAKLEAISVELTRREPGMFSQGAPFEGNIRQLRPLLRAEYEDPENPGYRRAVLGYCHDNILTLTPWARTNKAVNDRALWLEDLMEEYTWFFRYSGVARILYWGRGEEKQRLISNNPIYGRPINYYVRTEKLRSVSEKELEEICIRVGITSKLEEA